MTRKYLKPSKPAAFLEIVGGVVAIVFGVFFFNQGDAPLPGFIRAFAFVWFLVAIASIVIGFINMGEGKGLPTEEIIEEHDEDPEERLRKLTRLRDARLITDTEFERKRAEVMREL